jgi:hypothetical protein
MRKPHEFSTRSGGTDHQNWGALFRRLHPVKTAEHVAAAIGAPVRSVENWMAGAASPSLRWFVALVSAYGPDVLAHVFPGHLTWLSAARRTERQAALEAQSARLAAEWADFERGAGQ